MPKFRSLFLLWGLFLFLCLLTSCNLEKTTYQFLLEADLNIGVENGNENILFAGIENISLDSQENIYILDRKNFRIQKFDQAGRFLKGFKLRKGDGPEETSRILAVAVTPKGKLFVQDNNGTKIIVLDEEGSFVRSFTTDVRFVDILTYSEDKVIILGLYKNHIFHIFNDFGEYLESFGTPFVIPPQYENYADLSVLRVPTRASRSKDGNFFAVNPHRYEIRVYANKKMNRVIEHDSVHFSPFRIFSSEDSRISMRFPWVPVLEHNGNLFVTMSSGPRDNRSYHLDIFEKEAFAKTLDVNGFAFAIDSSGRLYFAEQDEFPHLVRYKIKKK